MRSLTSDARTRALAIGATFVACLPMLVGLRAPIAHPQLEGALLVYPELLLRGLAPYRDFFASDPPGNLILLAGAFAALGPSVEVERALGFASRLALVLGLAALAGRRGPLIAGIAGIAAALMLLPTGLLSLPWIWGMALVVWAVVALESDARRGAGILLAAAPWLRLELLAPVLLLIALERRSRVQGRSPLRDPLVIAPAMSLAAAVTLTVWISPHFVWQALVVEPLLQIGPARRIPLGDIHREPLLLLLALLLGVGAATAATARAAPGAARLASARSLVVCCALAPWALQRLDGEHLIAAALAPTSLLVASLDRVLERASALFGTAIALTLTVGTPAIQYFATTVPHLLRGVSVAYLQHGDRHLPARSESEMAAFARVGSALAGLARPGERLLIGPRDLSRANHSDLHLYFLFPELQPGGYYLEYHAGSANRPGGRLAADVASSDWLLLSGEWDAWDDDSTTTRDGDSRSNAVVRTDFHRVARHGVWELFQRRSQ